MRALYASFFVVYDCQALRPRERREKGERYRWSERKKNSGGPCKEVRCPSSWHVIVEIERVLGVGNTHGLSTVYSLCETTSCY